MLGRAHSCRASHLLADAAAQLHALCSKVVQAQALQLGGLLKVDFRRPDTACKMHPHSLIQVSACNRHIHMRVTLKVPALSLQHQGCLDTSSGDSAASQLQKTQHRSCRTREKHCRATPTLASRCWGGRPCLCGKVGLPPLLLPLLVLLLRERHRLCNLQNSRSKLYVPIAAPRNCVVRCQRWAHASNAGLIRSSAICLKDRREHLDVRPAAASPVHMEVAPRIHAAGSRPCPAICLLSMQQRRLCLEQARLSVRRFRSALRASPSAVCV